MRSNGSRYRFVLTVLSALSMMATLGHAQESQQRPPLADRGLLVDASSISSAEGALLDTGGIAGGSSECEDIGDWILVPPLSGTFRFRGNAYTVASDANLVEIAMELQIASGTSANIEFAVYTKDESNTWIQLYTATQNFVGTGARAMRRSGVINPPLELVSGVQYAIGAAWGAQNVSYNQDLAQYPQNFSIGTIDGRVGRNSVSAPLPLSLPPLAINDNAYSMELCVTGACCLPGGACDDTTKTDCLSRSGEFAAAGVSCASVEPCPLPLGACCLGGGTCAFLNEFSCATLGGAWSEGVPCNDPSEPCAPRGGCCLNDTTCLNNVTTTVCAASFGTYRGDNISCSAFPPCAAGACCIDGSCVLELTRNSCVSAGGEFAGAGTNCEDDPCTTTGACCQGTTCSETTAAECTTVGGSYRGDDTTCATLTIACGRGACCVDGVGCQDANGAGMTRTFCTTTLSGTFSEGDSCGTIEPRCPGTCCAFGGSTCVDDVIPAECLSKASGIFIGYATTCSTTDACDGPFSPGSCCVGDGRCVEVDSAETCTNDLRGVYSAGEACAVDSCPAGACCDRFALTCTDDVLEANCPDEWTEGTRCADLQTPCEDPRGACCDRTSLICIDDLFEVDCVGEWTEGVLCSNLLDPCAPLGACCVAGVCVETSFERCQNIEGVYRGDATSCLDVGICDVGACCQRDGSCQNDVAAADCVADPDAPTPDYFALELCQDVCEPRGACCVDGDCRVATSSGCAADTGIYHGDGSECVTDICVGGACCDDFAGACTDDQLAIQCPDGTWTIGVACDAVTCVQTGACCDPDNRSCTDDVPQANCMGVDATWTANVICDILEPPCQFAPTGSCCNNTTFVCNDGVVAFYCMGADETWTEGVRCGELDPSCVAPETGACCSAGSCTTETPDDCVAGGGTYLGADSICDDGCELGACCELGGTCTDDALRRDCMELTDTFTVGATCDAVPCTVSGACCISDCFASTIEDCVTAEGIFDSGICCRDSACTVGTPEECDTLTGTYGGNGTTCDAGFCNAGACCTGNSGCTKLSGPECEAGGDVFQGVDSTCDSGVCDAGCCCGVDGSFTNSSLRSACDALDQRFEVGLCSNLDPPCEARGACCLPDGVDACLVQTRTECDAISGATYAGDATTCDAGNLCEVGACCMGEECADLMRLDCVGGTYLGQGSTCTSADTCVVGGCCLEDEVCHDVPLYECDDAAGLYLGAGVLCERESCDLCDPLIVSSDPVSCLIDARYPHDSGDTGVRLGWDSIVLTLSCEPSSIAPSDFAVSVVPNDVAVPGIASAVLDVTTVTVTLDAAIPDGHWTCVTHVASDSSVCLGSLPADVNGDQASSPGDILDLIDDLNGTLPMPLGIHQCDVDRSDSCTPADILGVIDLLNGAGEFQAWNGATLPACPAAP